MLPLRIAWRFLRSSLGQSVLIIGGIAVGIAVQVFVGSLITSLQADLVGRTVGSAPHITIEAKSQGDTIEYSERLRRLVTTEPQVNDIAPVRTFSAIYTEDSESAPLAITGGQPDELDGIYGFRSKIAEGDARLGSGDMLVGTDFANRYGVLVGDELALTLPDGGRITYTVSGIFDLGSGAANERTAFVSAEAARSAIGAASDEFSAILVQVDDVFATSVITEDWKRRVPATTRVVDWQQQNAELLQGLRSQSASSYMIQTFVLVAVALGIASTLVVTAVQKTRQVGILKALGMSDRRTGLIFMWEGGLLGIIGTLAGLALGLGLIAVFQLAARRPGSALFEIRPEVGFIVISATVGIVVSLASALLPARRTARLDAIEVIQNG